ncbi:hypothetical protein [uncultured Sphingomonas sp.]|uniref:hypothetical protein n=1 Tax=uncultured Sphingomonas sp. TaxID=158754 RepID=UPI0025D58962|nr:hypothetical protein [uncultured Sphingomonas sp.]
MEQRNGVATRLIGWFATSPWTIPLIFAASALMRILWVFKARTTGPLLSEIHQVTATLARTGVIANAYHMDGIPTTHVGFVAPALGAAVYRLFGIDSLPSEMILFGLATAILFGTMLLLDRCFALLGETQLMRRLAIALFLLVPVNINMETQDFRIREGNEACFVLMGVLLAALTLDRAREIRWRDVIGLGALAAFLFLLSPAVAVPAYAVCGVLALRRMPLRRWPGMVGIAAGLLVLFSLPWAIRNHDITGKWLWSRGNAGLELGVGTYAEGVSPADPGLTFRHRLQSVHPFQSKEAYERMQAVGGEVAYAEVMGQEATAWARAHPMLAAKLWLRHVGQFYMPPPWLWSLAGHPGHADVGRSAYAALFVLLAAATLIAFLWRRRWLYLYPLAIIMTAVIPYIGPQPRTRYRYIITALLIFLAVAGTVRAARWLAARHRRPKDVAAASLG